MAARGFLQVAPGRRLALNGVEWTVEDVHGQHGRLVLVDGDGHAETRSFRWLINHADLRFLPAAEAPGRPAAPVSRQPRTLADLTEDQLERARLRAAHVLEAETGFREGHPARALPGEPGPAYDPDRTTLTQRRHTKAAEMKAMPRPEAARLGLQHLSFRTLERLSGLAGDSLLLTCADGRWTRRRSGHRSVTEEVREAIFAVKAECGERARLSLAARHRLMHQYMRERFPAFPTEKIPSRWDVRGRLEGVVRARRRPATLRTDGAGRHGSRRFGPDGRPPPGPGPGAGLDTDAGEAARDHVHDSGSRPGC
ncbi:hypothetical protein OG206_00250 [Streptomyces sp. NBC_01341]|uniref:hypothetical protein n=1 Tax=Streptomyces sp. NBC_01341 TaxID=2903831 RepID=UPI002E0FEEB5|nr:hypothetical protein OG206_00250 [Streptomyces sp. NBC_01341]